MLGRSVVKSPISMWSNADRVPAVSVWQHCRPADTGDSFLSMPHKSKKDKVKLFSWACVWVMQDSACCVYCPSTVTHFCQESTKVGRGKKSGGKNGPVDDRDVSMSFLNFSPYREKCPRNVRNTARSTFLICFCRLKGLRKHLHCVFTAGVFVLFQFSSFNTQITI